MSEIRGAFASMRLTLWVGIVLNVAAASLVLQIHWLQAAYITICLCLSSAFSFLINDLLDREIDIVNQVRRPLVSVHWTWSLAALNIVALAVPVFPPFRVASVGVAAALAGILVLGALYSLAFAKVLLLKNVLAALLATSPLWVCLLTVQTHWHGHFLAIVVALALCVVAREIKFDQFDAEGDRAGGRMTLPHILPVTAVSSLERLLTVAATCILLLVALQSADTWQSGMLPLLLALAIGLALYIPLKEAKDIHYTTITRITMVIVPLYIVCAL